MYLSISTTSAPVADLTYLLHKHPDRLHHRALSVGDTRVFCTELTAERCTVALLLDVDAIGLVRGQGAALESFTLGQYVNDRPYVASSLLTGAIRGVFGTALAGNCATRPERVAAPLDLELHLPTVACERGEGLIRALWEPLGWRVDATALPLDPELPEWGDARIFDVRLTGTATVQQALQQLIVLLPVLDDAKHYWVDHTEADKLLRHGGDWLGSHPEKELILRRFLRHQRDLISAAQDDAEVPGTAPDGAAQPSLARQRRDAVHAELRSLGATSVLDMGCGQGALLAPLFRDRAITRLVGADVSARALAQAERRLGLDEASDAQRRKVSLIQSSLTYRDDRLRGFDAMVLMEVIEHLDADRIPSLVRTVFAEARPTHVIVTTPNVEYNANYPGLIPGGLRNHDHRFEWTRAEFAAWAERVGAAHGYSVRFAGIGPEDAALGPATQMAVFTRGAGDVAESSAPGAAAGAATMEGSTR
ncbi:3' terminal RNA ribose 2'-O-methyltransferase Hen1 [Leucobacter luti]|uniref:Small RNA 2'-O-methyltransferase n=1 Tax=Leucobacter luti TaxID=340320 RepID=A0A4Q7TJP3_9MICO|nr:3' terminal RNA ribose 2'-O-methyltransferase Hen1 [Leucobacter luti]MBL3699696.1 3' terminal RNA ribose 2'-O-methyltransferase Hen1 [Leucobacter luti]RZT59472.1 3' terminal RNA ribose 2'-O-methyltransferase Hen1 [Leucobacter luti]